MGLTHEEEALLLELLEKQSQQDEIDKIFRPQPGPQEIFLNSTADIAIYGGSAGGGKSYALLLENIRHIDNPRFGSVIFRRTSMQVFSQGGLWDEAIGLYLHKGAEPKQTPRPTMVFPTGAKVAFAHLQHDTDVHGWQGSQIPLICFDELCHFTKKQFIYMMSRNRSTCGVKPYMRATCNPDADSWVKDLIEWYLDDDGYAIPERSGVIRYFLVIDDKFCWADTREELAEAYGVPVELVKSFTFVSSSVFDNKILLDKDPGYLASLNALGTVEKGRLLHGNWKIKPSSGMYFKRSQAPIVTSIPGKLVKVCRAWDLAATVPTPENPSPDATAGVLIGKLDDDSYIVLGLAHGRWASNDVRKKVLEVAKNDKKKHSRLTVRIPQDPGQAGKEQSLSYVKLLAGHNIKVKRVTGDKITRAEPFSAQWQAGNVKVLQGDWNDAYFKELEEFPDGKHDDIVDASSDAYTEVLNGRSWAGVTT